MRSLDAWTDLLAMRAEWIPMLMKISTLRACPPLLLASADMLLFLGRRVGERLFAPEFEPELHLDVLLMNTTCTATVPRYLPPDNSIFA